MSLSKLTQDMSQVHLLEQIQDSTSTMNIAEMNEHCQVHLFNRMHLSDSFRLRAMCGTLNAAFFVHAATRHSLSINIGRYQKATEPNDIVCRYLNGGICDFLLATFPSITHLTIRFVQDFRSDEIEYALADICNLLSGWSRRLLSLKMDFDLKIGLVTKVEFYDSDDYYYHGTLNRIFYTINQLPALNSLHLRLNALIHQWVCLQPRYDLSFLGRLTEFIFEANDCLNLFNIYDTLVKHAMPNAALKVIHFIDIPAEFTDHERLFKLDADFTRKFTSLGPNLSMNGPELFLYAPKFTSLKYLNVHNPYLSLDQVTALLAEHMPQLETLKLCLSFLNLSVIPRKPLTPLPSIRTLHLKCGISSHTNIRKCLNPPQTFPKLEKAITEICRFKCNICQIPKPNSSVEAVQACRDLLERPLGECPKLTGPVVRENEDNIDFGLWTPNDEPIDLVDLL